MTEIILAIGESWPVKTSHEVNGSWRVAMLCEINRSWPIVVVRTAIVHRETGEK